MFQTSMGAALEVQISNTVTHLTIVAVMISGALCILCALISLAPSVAPMVAVFWNRRPGHVACRDRE